MSEKNQTLAVLKQHAVTEKEMEQQPKSNALKRIKELNTIAKEIGINEAVMTVTEIEGILAKRAKPAIEKIIAEHMVDISVWNRKLNKHVITRYLKYDGKMAILNHIGVRAPDEKDEIKVERVYVEKNGKKELEGWQHTSKLQRIDGSIVYAVGMVGVDEDVKYFVGVSKSQTRSRAKGAQIILAPLLAELGVASTPHEEIEDATKTDKKKKKKDITTKAELLNALEQAEGWVLRNYVDTSGKHTKPEALKLTETIAEIRKLVDSESKPDIKAYTDKMREATDKLRNAKDTKNENKN